MEIWKPVPGMPYYEVSDQGRVRSYLARHKYSKFIETPRPVKFELIDDGGYVYARLMVYKGEKKVRRNFRLHRLVLETFVGPPPAPGMHGCHGDGDKLNCRLANLRWDTPAGNAADKIKHGTLLDGERHYNHKLTAEQVAEIKAKTDWRKGDVTAMASRFGVSPDAVTKVKTGVNRRNG